MPGPDTRPERPVVTPLPALVEWLAATTGLTVLGDPAPVRVTGASLGSSRVRPGDLYAALPGARAHGASYVAEAVAAGAVAVLTDPAGETIARAAGPLAVPLLVVPAPRDVLGRLSAEVFGRPAEALTTIGVTGTQGKTTTTRLAEGGLQAAGVRAAVVGTVGTRVDGHDVKTSLTTPEAPDLHGLFAMMVERGVDVCAMEVSSHALVMGRVDGVRFDVAVFLNLGRDHLDFHADVEDYYRAKASLFTAERCRRALVNLDDEHGRRLADEIREAGLPVVTFSGSGRPGADWTVADVELEASRSIFTVLGPAGERLPSGCPLPGRFNVDNTLAAVAALAVSGLDPAVVRDVAAAVASGSGVPGRFERVDVGQDFAVVVDYAHKPDAVEAALRALRPLTDGRLLLVLGAGGDRDRGKRPLMGEIGARLADLLVVTDDNPRTEDPAAIRSEVVAGAAQVPHAHRAEVLELGDRRTAIARALASARSGDIVLVAGKGHESGQEVSGTVHPFDDRVVVAEELARVLDGAISVPEPT